jgi:integrase/recombinase XerD
MKQQTLNDTYNQLLQAYTQWLKTLGFAFTTVYDFTHFTKYFLLYVQNKNITSINQLNHIQVKDYFNHLEQATGIRTRKAFSSAHLNRQFLAVDKFLEFLYHMGLQTVPAPTKHSIERKALKTIVVLSIEQIQILYATIPLLFDDLTMAKREDRQACVKLMLDLCYGCGLRRSEALNLKIQHVNFDTKTIHVVQGKFYKDRLVPMSNAVYQSLQAFIYQQRRQINTGRQGYVYPFKSNALAKALLLLLKHCNNTAIKQLKPTLHSLRHSLATHLLQKGMNINNIGKLLGHSSLQSTQLYTHFISNEL